jgi:hypothetical protein
MPGSIRWIPTSDSFSAMRIFVVFGKNDPGLLLPITKSDIMDFYLVRGLIILHDFINVISGTDQLSVFHGV